eukprot:g28909.t1
MAAVESATQFQEVLEKAKSLSRGVSGLKEAGGFSMRDPAMERWKGTDGDSGGEPQTHEAASEVEYEELLVQFVRGVIVTLEEAQDGHVTQAVGGGVKMVGDQKVLSFVTNRTLMFYKMVSKPPLGYSDATDKLEEQHLGGPTAQWPK